MRKTTMGIVLTVLTFLTGCIEDEEYTQGQWI